MLPFFPTPYPEETFYSVLARFHIYSGNVSAKHTVKDLFGKTTRRSMPDFISGVASLLEALPGGNVKVEQVIYNHTFFPFYSAFIPQSRVTKIVENMTGDAKSEVHKSTGISASSVLNYRYLKHCSLCVAEDIETYGETYWHRVHQLPGVWVCPKHCKPLLMLDKQLYQYNQHQYLSPSNRLLDSMNTFACDEETLDLLFKVAKEARWLMRHRIEMKDYNFYRDKYISRLQELGIATVGGRVNQEEWKGLLTSTYKEQVLKLLDVPIPEQGINWSISIVRKHRKVFHPIHHILTILLLFGSLEKFYAYKSRASPFGKGPWECLNRAHPHYVKKVVQLVEVSRCTETKRPVGTFYCNCGFVYKKRASLNAEESSKKKIKVVEYGDVWKKKLFFLSNEGLPTRKIGRLMGVDSKTVKKQLLLLQTNEKERATKEKKKGRNPHLKRREWEVLRKKYPEKSVTQLRKVNPALYMSLYRNDKQWLKEHSPLGKRRATSHQRIDWKKRDKELLGIVQKIVKDWDRYEKERVKKITVTSIAEKAPRPYIIMNKAEKIPRTMEYIKTIMETDEEYRIRSLERASNELIKGRESLEKWKLYRKAGIRSEYITESIEEYVASLLF